MAEESFKRLVVLHTRIDDINEEFQGLAGPHRRRFLEELVTAGGDKVVFALRKLDPTMAPARKSA